VLGRATMLLILAANYHVGGMMLVLLFTVLF
jgi:hypothetical protein